MNRDDESPVVDGLHHGHLENSTDRVSVLKQLLIFGDWRLESKHLRRQREAKFALVLRDVALQGSGRRAEQVPQHTCYVLGSLLVNVRNVFALWELGKMETIDSSIKHAKKLDVETGGECSGDKNLSERTREDGGNAGSVLDRAGRDGLGIERRFKAALAFRNLGDFGKDNAAYLK